MLNTVLDSPAEERVVLVDARDRAVGTAGKLAAHREGRLHRAFSVVVLNTRGEMLLQRRALSKYHSGGLWSNACCGHPRPDEDVVAAGQRRLWEEMQLSCSLQQCGAFVYAADVDAALREHEYDHLLVGYADTDPRPDVGEAMAWRWTRTLAVTQDALAKPKQYTAWFPFVLSALAKRRPGAPRVPGGECAERSCADASCFCH